MEYKHFVIALGIRLFLIVWGHFQDQLLQVKYTDVDYQVFTDAARYVARGESPYERPTYRYTPLLAWILTPNIWTIATFGKLLFSVVDIINGLLIYGDVEARYGSKAALTSTKLWLYNPFTLVISTRGNAETLITLSVLLTLYFHRRCEYFKCGVALGLAVHLKIYPIIYSLVLYMGSSPSATLLQCLSPTWNRFKLVVGFISVLLLTTSLFYYLYGWRFLFETYIYHVVRKDVRHNFSPYFYLLYLQSDEPMDSLASSTGLALWLPFLLQFTIVIVLSFRYRSSSDLSWGLLVLTFSFVTFNKVVTAQYFLWYVSLLPLCLPELNLSRAKSVVMTTAWSGAVLVWLFLAWLLEFQGYSVFVCVWMASLQFLVTNIWIATECVKARRPVQLNKKAS